jgi:hypothetical protein
MAQVLSSASGTMQALSNEMRQGRLPGVGGVSRQGQKVTITFMSQELLDAEAAYDKQLRKIHRIKDRLEKAEEKLHILSNEKQSVMAHERASTRC